MIPARVPEVRTLGPARLTAGLDQTRRLDYAAHRLVHAELPSHTVESLTALAEAVDMRGRGGAGFPFARKLGAVAKAVERRKLDPVVVVNATEGEPASSKDKMLLLRAPHLILDGALLAAAALDAQEVVIGIEENSVGESSMLAAIEERELQDYVRVVGVLERFISGEGGSLVNRINGRTPVPRTRGGRTSDSGVKNLPTLLSNAETYSQLAILAELGPEKYAEVGSPRQPGTVLLTIGGTAPWPAVVEVPTDVAFADALELCGVYVVEGVLTGGYHGAWMTAEQASKATLSRDGMSAAGGVLGAGIVCPLDGEGCPLGEVARVTAYLAEQSAGQCGPCMYGLPEVARALISVADGTGGDSALETVRSVTLGTRGRGACSHPDGTAKFVLSALEVFADDLQEHLLHGTCGRPVVGALPLPTPEVSEYKLMLDWNYCVGHGLCAGLVPDLIRLDQHGFPVLPTGGIPANKLGDVRRAVEMCPALALRLEVKN